MLSFRLTSGLNSWMRAAAMAAALAVTSLVGASAAMAPTFTLPSRSGDTVSLDQLKGKVVMLNFWASWCGPCRQEMPLLEQMHKRYSALGFTLVGVNVEANTKDAERWLSKTPVSFPVLFDRESKVSKLYDVKRHAEHRVHRSQGQRALPAQGLQGRRRRRVPESDPRAAERVRKYGSGQRLAVGG